MPAPRHIEETSLVINAGGRVFATWPDDSFSGDMNDRNFMSLLWPADRKLTELWRAAAEADSEHRMTILAERRLGQGFGTVWMVRDFRGIDPDRRRKRWTPEGEPEELGGDVAWLSRELDEAELPHTIDYLRGGGRTLRIRVSNREDAELAARMIKTFMELTGIE